jgi:hypothetical protein
MIRKSVTVVALLGLAGTASAQVNGTTAGDSYGAPLAVQTTQTGFGDNASELNAMYARVDGGRLYVALTGNIEANFNKLEFFLDSRSGGETTFSGVPGNDGVAPMANRLVFPNGFAADYHLIIRRGNDQGTNRFDVDFAFLGGAASSYGNLFAGNLEGVGSTGIGVNAFPMQFAYDNANLAGVIGGNAAADPIAAAAVQTGLEFSIDLRDLGISGSGLVPPPDQNICMIAFQNNQGHNYASNQFLPGLPTPQGNWGGDGAGGFTGNLDLNMAAGVFANYTPACIPIPAPASLSLLGLAGVAAARRRRA